MQPELFLSSDSSLYQEEYSSIEPLGAKPNALIYAAKDRLGDSFIVTEFAPEGLFERFNNEVSALSGNEIEFEESLKVFQGYSKLLSRLSHPNVEGVIQRFDENGTAYIVTEAGKMSTIADQIASGTFFFQPNEVEQAGHGLAKVGQYMRSFGLSGFTITPEAVTIDDETTQPSLLLRHFLDGTAAFKEDEDNQTALELYSFAETLYTMVSMRRPVPFEERMQTLQETKSDPLVPLTDRYEDFDQGFLLAIDQNLELETDKRFSGFEIWDPATLETTASAAAFETVRKPQAETKKKGAWLPISLVALLLAGGAGYFAVSQGLVGGGTSDDATQSAEVVSEAPDPEPVVEAEVVEPPKAQESTIVVDAVTPPKEAEPKVDAAKAQAEIFQALKEIDEPKKEANSNENASLAPVTEENVVEAEETVFVETVEPPKETTPEPNTVEFESPVEATVTETAASAASETDVADLFKELSGQSIDDTAPKTEVATNNTVDQTPEVEPQAQVNEAAEAKAELVVDLPFSYSVKNGVIVPDANSLTPNFLDTHRWFRSGIEITKLAGEEFETKTQVTDILYRYLEQSGSDKPMIGVSYNDPLFNVSNTADLTVDAKLSAVLGEVTLVQRQEGTKWVLEVGQIEGSGTDLSVGDRILGEENLQKSITTIQQMRNIIKSLSESGSTEIALIVKKSEGGSATLTMGTSTFR